MSEGERGEAEAGAARQPAPECIELAAGTQVGRYEIVALVARGGSGMVYRARDPRLGRTVALKLIASDDGVAPRETQARLLREAQTLAQLAHPNVVEAFDIGVHQRAVYIVMELIDGVSLAEWRHGERSHAERLQALIAAGRGLAAAHAAGIVHRDFKPENVMVSGDGRVRVVDFGLARADPAESCSEPALARSGVDADSIQPWSTTTRSSTGATPSRSSAVSGTPGYVAPEQLLGRASDTRSDQFSYAVTAFVTLVGTEPYPDVLAASRASSGGGSRIPWPASSPRRLRAVIDRGLALRAEERYPSLAVMVAELERAASPRKRWPLMLGLTAAAAACSTIIATLPRDRPVAAVCREDQSAFSGVWDRARRAAVERAFRATGRSNAGEAFELIAARLDAFQAQWHTLRRQSCEASGKRGEQPERIIEWRAACLDRAREGAKTLVEALLDVDARRLDRVAGGFPPSLATCLQIAPNDPELEPSDPALRATIDEVQRGISVTRALVSAARGPEAVERATQTLELARNTGHLPTIAAASAQLGRASWAAAQTPEQKEAAETRFKESLQLAASAGDNSLLARTSSFLFLVIAYGQRRIRDAEAMLPSVEAMVARAGNPPDQRIEMLMGKASILSWHLKLSEALQALDEVRLLSQSVEGENRTYGSYAAGEQGAIHTELGDHVAAAAAQRQAVDGVRAIYGVHHPRVIVTLANLARAQARGGSREAAMETLAELRSLAAEMTPDEPRLYHVPVAHADVWSNLGEPLRAIPFFREALAKLNLDFARPPRRLVLEQRTLG